MGRSWGGSASRLTGAASYGSISRPRMNTTRTELVLYPPPEGFSADTTQLAEWLAAQAGIALENARLHDLVQRQAITDDLTGLVNRRRFLEVLDTEVERAAQFGSGLGIVLIDLDDFKGINDRFGHHSGDRVLAAFGGLLQEHIRDVDLAARLGGEEFALLLPEIEGRDAVLVAERLRRSLSERPDRLGGRERAQLDGQLRRRPVPAGGYR